MELDGNLPNLAVGGGTVFGAGINGGHFGILIDGDGIGGQSKNVTIRNVDCHDFGYCGLTSGIHNAAYIINLRMYNSKFNRNGCCGFAWKVGLLSELTIVNSIEMLLIRLERLSQVELTLKIKVELRHGMELL